MAPSSIVFVAADEPLLVFSSASEAFQYLEAVDVKDGIYSAAYGPNGEPYDIYVDDGLVFVEPLSEPPRPDDLRQLLLNYLQVIGRKPADTRPLDQLVATVWSLHSRSNAP